MKSVSVVAFVSALVLLSACADVEDAPLAQTTGVEGDSVATTLFTGQPIAIDTVNSSILWEASKVTRTHDGGFEDFTGSVYVENDAVTGVEVQIVSASIFSDSDRLTGHLQSDDFFDVEVFPSASFAASSFEPLVGDSIATHTVTGELTMRDQTNRISFPATIAVTGDSVMTQADFIINRQDWGLSYPGAPDDLIRDNVRISLDVVVARN